MSAGDDRRRGREGDRRGDHRGSGVRGGGQRGSGPQRGGNRPGSRPGAGRPNGDRPGPARSRPRPDEPAIPDDVTPNDLDPEVRRDLRALDKASADAVARHLVMVGRLADEDPVLALAHARAARERASRIGVIRETAGIAAYHAGEWQEALGELRAAKRLQGGTSLLPLIADCERGLGRPERALDIARGEDARLLTDDERIEMLIVEAGARLDLGEPEKAVVTLQRADLTPGQTGPEPTRLFYAYAEALLAAGRDDEATTWFMNAAAADVDDLTDAELRVVELSDPDYQPTEPENPATRPETAAIEPETAASDPVVSSREPETVSSEPESSSNEPETASTEPGPTLAEEYDAVLLDLDGTVFAGHAAVPGAIDAVAALPAERIRYVTNNASRRPAEVADHLRDLGFDAVPDQVVTSAQAGARLAARQLPSGSTVLVVGTDGLAAEVAEVGLVPTRTAADDPRAVIQGHSTETGWADLSEAALAIAAGAVWIATNVDTTLPSERGLLIGNGSMVAAVASATDATPLVAGKPAAPLLHDAIESVGSTRPLVVGDRLDTDIEGANTVEADSLMVLTGVSSLRDVLAAPVDRRPTHIARGLPALLEPASASEIGRHHPWEVRIDGSRVRITSRAVTAEAATALPALVAAVWTASLDAAAVGDLAVTSDNPAVVEMLRDLGVG
ncbi:HAD hydrolase-like protein [Gordonia sp. X0973]|uniref:HAD-IIA family hydrolase n=1 Tax=Gordonia sp. X0973 TaxID=2742602 RepID=UPI000F54B8B4|nr:HAD hydrolase-like protein [Gordonia sp. X0973]QKT07158.1 HAD hydrolase-like protein [Gordonia sp. X0973]